MAYEVTMYQLNVLRGARKGMKERCLNPSRLSQWARALDISAGTLTSRLNRGWRDEAILTTPVTTSSRNGNAKYKKGEQNGI